MDYTPAPVVAILVTAVALAGLELLFSAVLFSQVRWLHSTGQARGHEGQYVTLARWGLALFVGDLAITWLGVVWLLAPSSSLLGVVRYGFAGVLLVTVVHAAIVLTRVFGGHGLGMRTGRWRRRRRRPTR